MRKENKRLQREEKRKQEPRKLELSDKRVRWKWLHREATTVKRTKRIKTKKEETFLIVNIYLKPIFWKQFSISWDKWAVSVALSFRNDWHSYLFLNKGFLLHRITVGKSRKYLACLIWRKTSRRRFERLKSGAGSILTLWSDGRDASMFLPFLPNCERFAVRRWKWVMQSCV